MSEALNFSNSMEGMSNLNFLEMISDTVSQISELFDRTIDAVAKYGVGVAQKVKKLGVKFLKTMGFIDLELNQIWTIKNHLRDIQNAVKANDPAVRENAGILVGGLMRVWDELVDRMNYDNGFYNNLSYSVLECKPIIDEIVESVEIK